MFEISSDDDINTVDSGNCYVDRIFKTSLGYCFAIQQSPCKALRFITDLSKWESC